jgi:hypothetical protein
MSPRGTVLAFDRDVSRADDVTGGDVWLARPHFDTSPETSGAEGEAGRDAFVRVERVEAAVDVLRERVEHLAARTVLMIETLAPLPLRLLKPFHITVEPYDGGFKAYFADGGLTGSGETVGEAIWSLKDLMAVTYESLSELQEQQLGPGPRRQFAVLREFISA